MYNIRLYCGNLCSLPLPLPLSECWCGSRPICGLARGLLFVNVSISCVLRNVELFNLNFPRCAEAPLSLGPAALPCPWHKAITQTQSHTGHAGAAAVRIAPQGNGKNIAPGRQNKSYNESARQSRFNPRGAGRETNNTADLHDNILEQRNFVMERDLFSPGFNPGITSPHFMSVSRILQTRRGLNHLL